MGVVQEAYGLTITAVLSSLELKRPHCGRFKSHSLVMIDHGLYDSDQIVFVGHAEFSPPMVTAHQAEEFWQRSDRFRRPPVR